MTRHLAAMAVAAAALGMPAAAAQSILHKTDAAGRSLESYLPPPAASVPWLNLDPRTKLPKTDLPIGRQAGPVGPLVLPPAAPDPQLSTNINSDVRRM